MQDREISDKNSWEGLLTELNAPASFFQSWNWGEFERSQGVDVFRTAYFDGADLKASAQYFLVSARRGRYLHVRNGPVFRSGLTANEIALVLDRLRQRARELDCSFVRISPLVENSPETSALFKGQGLVFSQMHDVDAEVTWLLDLNQSAEQILSGMRDSHRYLVRKSLKLEGLEIIKTADPKQIEDFWPIYRETFERQHWKAYKLPYLISEFNTFAPDGQVLLFLARYQGKYIAGSMFIYYRGQVYYHHSGSLTATRNIPAMYRIHWESILEAQARGMKSYNFFGIARAEDPQHPWAGLTLFKKGFGGRQQEWQHAMDMPLKTSYWLTHFYEKLERRRRGY